MESASSQPLLVLRWSKIPVNSGGRDEVTYGGLVAGGGSGVVTFRGRADSLPEEIGISVTAGDIYLWCDSYLVAG